VEGDELGELIQELEVDPRRVLGEDGSASLGDTEEAPPGRFDQPRLLGVCPGPAGAVPDHRLAAREELLALLRRGLELGCERVDHLAESVLPLVGEEPEQREHEGLVVGDRHQGGLRVRAHLAEGGRVYRTMRPVEPCAVFAGHRPLGDRVARRRVGARVAQQARLGEQVSNPLKEFSEELLAEVQRNPLDITKVITQLRTATDVGQVVDPADETAQFRVWNPVLVALFNARCVYQATEVGLAWYSRLCELERVHGKRFHKGGPAQQIALCYLAQGRRHSAHWHFALAFVEDVRQQGGLPGAIPEAPASQALRLHFGRGEAYLQAVAEHAREPAQVLYPEEILVELARAGQYVGMRAEAMDEIPLNATFLQELTSRLDGGTADEKGRALEFLASYLMMLLPGVRLIPNARTPDHEMDLIVVQDVPGTSYLVEALGRAFLIECKNWTKSVGSEQLNHFASKMRFHRCSGGVIFARNGLSGGVAVGFGVSYARLTQLRWYQQDSCAILVVDLASIKSLSAGQTRLSEMLLSAYETVRFNLTS